MKMKQILILVLILCLGLTSATTLTYDYSNKEIKLNSINPISFEDNCIKEVRNECRRFIRQYEVQADKPIKITLEINKRISRNNIYYKIKILSYETDEYFYEFDRNYVHFYDNSRGYYQRAYSRGEFTSRVLYLENKDISRVTISDKINREYNNYNVAGDKSIGVIIGQNSLAYNVY